MIYFSYIIKLLKFCLIISLKSEYKDNNKIFYIINPVKIKKSKNI